LPTWNPLSNFAPIGAGLIQSKGLCRIKGYCKIAIPCHIIPQCGLIYGYCTLAVPAVKKKQDKGRQTVAFGFALRFVRISRISDLTIQCATNGIAMPFMGTAKSK